MMRQQGRQVRRAGVAMLYATTPRLSLIDGG